jgi:carboxyl-terminal processing protease
MRDRARAERPPSIIHATLQLVATTSWAAELDAEAVRAPSPFSGERVIAVVLPRVVPGLGESERGSIEGLEALLMSNAAALRVELGAPFQCVHDDPGRGPRWLIGPAQCNRALAGLGLPPAAAPRLHVDRARGLIASDAPDVASLPESFSLLRRMHWEDARDLESHDCTTLEEVVLRVVREVGRTWPSFERLGLSWKEICSRHVPGISSESDVVPALQRWLAELGDGHTRAWPSEPRYPPSFSARVLDGRLVLYEVPVGCAAWDAGAREGHRLDIDLGAEWQRVGASPHHRPFLVPYRMLSGRDGESRSFEALAPDGTRVSWLETYAREPALPLVSSSRLPSGAVHLRVRQWRPSQSVRQAIDAVVEDARSAPGLVVDLRGNGGGNVAMALDFRDRFVRERTHAGYRQFTDPFGKLAQCVPIFAEPTSAGRRWSKPVRFLTDPLTYSASEDLLMGLSGLSHVEVLGVESGGGSGQARSARLLPGWRLHVSSCLTFDRDGRCIEGAGVRVDRRVPLALAGASAWSAELLALADRSW